MELVISILLGLLLVALIVYGIVGKEFKVTIRHEHEREVIKPVQYEDLTEDEKKEIDLAKAQYIESLKESGVLMLQLPVPMLGCLLTL